MDKKCKSKGKDEVPVACYMAGFGLIKTEAEPYEDPKEVLQNLEKNGWYGDSTNKMFLKEMYSKNCNVKFGKTYISVLKAHIMFAAEGGLQVQS